MIDHKHLPNVLTLFFSTIGFIWAMWQHEIIVLPSVSAHWEDAFPFFFSFYSNGMSNGMPSIPLGYAYDFTLILQGVCFIVAVLSAFFWKGER